MDTSTTLPRILKMKVWVWPISFYGPTIHKFNIFLKDALV